MNTFVRRLASWLLSRLSLYNNNSHIRRSNSALNLHETEERSPTHTVHASSNGSTKNGTVTTNKSTIDKSNTNSSRIKLSWPRLYQRYFNARGILVVVCLNSIISFVICILVHAVLYPNTTRSSFAADNELLATAMAACLERPPDNHDPMAYGGNRLPTVKVPCPFLISYQSMQSSPFTRRVLSYNTSYPFTPPVRINSGWRYRIGMIADQDTRSWSAEHKHWTSTLRFGYLWISDNFTIVRFEWPDDKEGAADKIVYKSSFGDAGRGMELSELVVFNGHLYALDDRTGLIYDISDYRTAIPWVILTDGAGNVAKGFKSEWATVKDNMLYVGGWGKEWTTAHGEYQNDDPMWIKKVSADGSVEHVDWIDVYKKLRRAMGIEYPGFVIHEAAVWSQVQRRWFFLPRRSSHETYSEHAEFKSGTNMLVSASENFDDIRVLTVGNAHPSMGFSAFRFIPQTHDTVIVALKTEEVVDAETLAHSSATHAVVFRILPDDHNASTADVVMAETKIDSVYKFEGIEFL